MCVASLCADDDFSSSWDKNSLLGKLSGEESKKILAQVAISQKSLPSIEFLPQDHEQLSAPAQRQAKHTEKNVTMLQLL